MNQRRLFRDSSNEVIGGVASGIAKYFDVDVTIIRIFFVLAAIFGGWGVIVYIIFWIAVPREVVIIQDQTTYEETKSDSNRTDFSENRYKNQSEKDSDNKKKGSLIGGSILILIGVFFIIERFIPRIDFDDFWPFILVLLGLMLLFSGFIKTGRNER